MGRLNISISDELLRELDYQIGLEQGETRSEFIESAVEFYLSYLTSHRQGDYLNKSVTEGVRQGINDIERQTMPNIFRLAVEMSMLKNIMASLVELNPSELKRLRSDCVKAVRATNKRTDLENAVRYQQESLQMANAFYNNFSGKLDYSDYDDDEYDEEFE